MPNPLQVTIGGYFTTVTRNSDGSVTLAIGIGFPFGTQTLTIPQNEWEQIVNYVQSGAPKVAAIANTRNIVIYNTSTLYTADQLKQDIPGLEMQQNEDVAAAWGLPQTKIYSSDDPAVASIAITVKCYIMDNPDTPDVLGYHLLDNGQREIRVFAQPTLSSGNSMSTVLSHEITEDAIDPDANAVVMNSYVKEGCDPVEANYYPKGVNKTLVSNFVLPMYWGFSNRPSDGNKTDWLGLLDGAQCPAKLPGGYDIVYQSGQWTYQFADRINWRHMAGLKGRSAYRIAQAKATNG